MPANKKKEEEVKEIIDDEPVSSDDEEIVNQEDVSPVPEKEGESADRRPLYFGAGCILLLIILAAAIGTLGYNLYTSFFQQEQLLYSVQEQEPGSPFIAVMGVSTKGEDVAALAVEDDGLFVNRFIPEIGRGFVAKGGNNFVLRHETLDGRLYLYSDDRSLPTLISDESIPNSWIESFSPDGRLFAYTSINQKENERSVHIVDLVGDELIQINGAVFGTFMPSSDKAIVLEYDDRDNVYTSIVVISIPDGAYNHLIDIDDVSKFPRLFPSPDGRLLYYTFEKHLMAVDIKDASESDVYEFETEEGGLAFFKSDGKSLVILDPQKSSEQVELLLLDTRGGQTTRIDKDIYFRSISAEKCPQNRCYYGEPSIVFSPNGKLLAYMVNQPGDLDLYVAGIDGSNRTRIASDATWYSYDFSPDNKHIVYIEGEQTDRGGDLYIAENDGGNAIKLDSEVWSFKFTKDGKTILYFKIDDLDREDPESELLSTQLDGEKKERLILSSNGIFTFIQIP